MVRLTKAANPLPRREKRRNALASGIVGHGKEMCTDYILQGCEQEVLVIATLWTKTRNKALQLRKFVRICLPRVPGGDESVHAKKGNPCFSVAE
jgi:hypothetical protein